MQALRQADKISRTEGDPNTLPFAALGLVDCQARNEIAAAEALPQGLKLRLADLFTISWQPVRAPAGA